MTLNEYPSGPRASHEAVPAPAWPVIGMSAYAVRAGWAAWEGEAVMLPRAYINAVLAAGGVPVVLPPLPGVIEAVLPRIDGLVISGGPDVDPARYGAERDPQSQPPSLQRDAAEAALIAGSIDAGLPVLGVCRGMQVLNVLRGGTLLQHLPDVVGNDEHCPVSGNGFASHPVRLALGSKVALAHGRTDLPSVPTYHHQGVGRIGSGLVATAWADDGTIEALEDPSLPFCVGVQWHPEAGEDPSVFVALVEAARQVQHGRR